MSRVEHYRGLQTNIDGLYSSIKQELESEKCIKIVSEIKGEMNGKPLRSITAVNKSLVVLAVALRDYNIHNR
jgi:cytoskeletal protein CcmA (bactofilin family)